MLFKAHKIVAVLPVTLEPDTLYFVRVGIGFDLYCTDTTANIAYKINSLTSSEILDSLKTVDGVGSGLDADTLNGRNSTEFSLSTFNEEIISSQKNLIESDAKYQFLSCVAVQIINLPNPLLAQNKEFTIINTGNIDFQIWENGVNTNILLKEGGRLNCFSLGSNWDVFLEYQMNGVFNETAIIDGGVF